MRILHVVGARPNFVKAAPVVRALSTRPSARQTIVHTGQHYDINMSDIFFRELDMPPPDVNLQVGSGSHARQTAQILDRLEPVVLERKPDLVMVYGDVNSTIAAAFVCSKLLVPCAHVEAGLRSFDRTMPEEINRLLTDQIADFLFTSSEDANRNLAREGIALQKVHLVGNVMIDTLVRMVGIAQERPTTDLPERFVLVTLHRPGNVDDAPWLTSAIATLSDVSADIPVLFPVHPRTRRLLNGAVGERRQEKVRLMDPLPYLDFLGLQTKATAVITDSGGIQEETTFLGVPCLTVRENTERPITVELGTNVLVGRDMNRLRTELTRVLTGHVKPRRIPPLWDGHTAERIAAIIQ